MASLTSNTCDIVQNSLDWCEGRTVLPGIKRRLYFIKKSDIADWPLLDEDTQSYSGSFTLVADAYWKHIDILADKSQLTSEAQGEYPSQTQLNKLTAVHPGVEEEVNQAIPGLNNCDNVYLVPTTSGKWRVLGNKTWQGKTTVAQDLGQGPAGTASTTISVEHTDRTPCPFYNGSIVAGYVEVTENGTTTSVPVEGNENFGSSIIRPTDDPLLH